MDVTTLNTKGQITIPAQLRKLLKIKPGSSLRLFVEPDDRLVITATGSIKDGYGILPKPPKTYSIEEMDDAVEKAVSKHVLDL